MTTTAANPSTASARTIAEHLLQAFDAARPQISLPVIESLRQMVDETKHQDPPRAMQIARTALAAAELLAEPLALATAAWAMATAHVFLFELANALSHYRTAEAIFEANGQLRNLVSVQSPQVYVLNALGDPTAALELADRVRPNCLALGKDGLTSLVNLEMNVGTVLIQRGQFEASLSACDRASAAAAALGDSAALGRIDINRANVFQELDRYNDAERCYQQARQSLVASLHNRQQVALVDLNLGLLALRRGDYWQALQHLEGAASGFSSSAHIAWVDFNRALLYDRLNLNSETVELAARAVDALTAAASKRELAMALQVWASAAEKQGAFGEAEDLLLRANGYFRDCGAVVMALQVSLANAELALHNDNPDHAQALLQSVRQTAESEQIPSLRAQADLIEVEIALRQSQPVETPLLARCERAIVTLAAGGQNRLLLRAYRLWGSLLAQAGDLGSAQAAYQKALNVVLEMRHSLLLDEFQIAFLEQHLPIFLEAVALYLQSSEHLPQVAHLLALASTTPEQHRGEQHRGEPEESGKRESSPIATDDLIRLRSDWHWQQSKVEKLLGDGQAQNGGEVDAAQQQLRRIEVQIADGWRRRGVRTPDSEPTATLAQQICHWQGAEYVARLQDSLAQEEAYLHYFVIAGRLQLLLARRQSLRILALGATTAIDGALRAWRYHLRDWSMIVSQPALAAQIVNRPLSALFRALVQPLLPDLAGCTHLNLMLPPQWSDLPVAALLAEETPLIARWSLSQLVSPLSLLAEDKEQTLDAPNNSVQKRSLLIGLAQQSGLSQTPVELAQISAHARATWSHQLLLEGEATLENAIRGMVDCDLLHIASHATFRADNPLFSWLQLADSRLTVAELYHRVHLRRRPLTVLSACETARGQHSGLLGVARALLAVGAGELVATQWKVEDHASAQLMGEFYQQWFALPDATPKRPALALAAAQRLVAASWHPAYWAAFVNIR